jgi:hypothetical protein
MSFPFDVKEMENGNFRDASDKGNRLTKRAVEIENNASNPVPVFQIYGIARKLFGETVTQPNTDVSVLTYSVTEDKLKILSVNISCFVEGKASFLVNGSVIATGRTAPGKPDINIDYIPHLELVSGDQLEVKFKARPHSPTTEVESFINACEE